MSGKTITYDKALERENKIFRIKKRIQSMHVFLQIQGKEALVSGIDVIQHRSNLWLLHTAVY